MLGKTQERVRTAVAERTARRSARRWNPLRPDPVEANEPLVWLLLGGRKGDNNQLFALAQSLGHPFEAKRIRYNALRRLPVLRNGLTIVARQSRQLIAPPWPDLVLAVGYASVPVARHIRELAKGRVKLVHVGNPRQRIDDFDLQITTPQYARKGRKVLQLDLPIGNPAKDALPTREERDWLRPLPRPHRLVAVGGPARHWELDHRALREAIETLRSRAPRGSLIVATSPRTKDHTRHFLARLLDGRHEVLVDSFPSFATLLADSDEIHVTADSVSMLSEAILTRKPVGMIPIRRSLAGMLTAWLWELPTARGALPNFANFWNILRRRHLVGTVDLPVAAQVCDTVERAASAVRALLAPGDRVDEGRL
jgi:mitochondrial fission protein ELM1